jgi:hypothetical protein
VKHYAIEKWIDFVRGIVHEPERKEMEKHLKTDCASCNRQVTLLRAIAQTSKEIDVPEPLLDRARTIFRHAPVHRESPLRKLIAKLTFDSQSALAPAGVRSNSSGARRLVFGVEDFLVELLVDTQTARRTVVVTGQISREGFSVLPALHQVQLTAKQEVLDQTIATRFGEFSLEFARRAGLRLIIADENTRREIEVPLDLIFGTRNVLRRSRDKT